MNDRLAGPIVCKMFAERVMVLSGKLLAGLRHISFDRG